MKQDKVLSLIGLATKAGQTASGEFMTEREVKTGRAALVIVAGDTLGHAMGKEFRASLAILDEGFAKGVLKHLTENNETIA